ncbi:WEB family [Macleaya cordata]|uniref:WEB family n=1 Tax=Macleaya cordata TaxID=56857 RepID=A0A200QUU7_MACCD|nr:WEB family [Macleaya cordata]
MEVGESRETEERKRIQAVKGSVSFYGERIIGEKPGLKKTQMEFSEKLPTRPKELHSAQRDIEQFSKSRKIAESIRAQAESELLNARNKVKDLTLQIEESNLKAKARKQELEILKKSKRSEENSALDVGGSDCYEYAEVLKELESVKQELNKLKLDMANVLQTKLQADKETEAAVSRMRSCSRSIETLRKEIEEANEEQVLVELARIEAVREFGAIKAQREVEAAQFSSNMEKIQNRIKDVVREIGHAKELETKLAITTSDIGVLQSELKLVKAMEIRSVVKETSGGACNNNRSKEKSETSSLLQSVSDELEASKKELACIREEGYQLMASMDIIRGQFRLVSEETTEFKKVESRTDLTVQNLNSKLLRAKSRLEAASSAEEKAKSIVSNMSTTLQQLKSEADAAKRETELINEEMASLREEKQKNESEIDLSEERLQSVIQELEAVKASEAIALEKLKTLAEKTMKTRASKSQHTSSITISKFEYEYLNGCAKWAEKIADKKLVAAQAWIEAVKAGEKELELKIEEAQREIRELSLKEDQESFRTEKSLRENKAIEGDLNSGRWQQEKQIGAANLPIEEELLSKYMKDIGNATPRRAKLRRPGSPGGRHLIHSGSITLRKRRKVMPNLVNKLFSSSKAKMEL